MITKLYTAGVKLNKKDTEYHRYLLLENDNGILLVDKGLFVISFDDEEDMIKQGVEVVNKIHKGDITL